MLFRSFIKKYNSWIILYYLMSINKSIFYQLCNNGIMVNLYKLFFLSSHFSFQPNKRVFHLPNFPSLQPNTHEEKLNIFHPPTFLSSHNFPSFYFSTPPTKRALSLHLGSILFAVMLHYTVILHYYNLTLIYSQYNNITLHCLER